MSLLSYTGVGSVVLTVAGLVKMGMKRLGREQERAYEVNAAGRPGSERAIHGGLSVYSAHGRGGYPGAQRGGYDRADGAVLPASDLFGQQVIVVADNCSDATAALARRAGATVIEGKGGSKAAAQNLALPYVVSDVVVAIDGDNTLDPAAVAHIVTTMRAGYAGTCAAVLPKGHRHALQPVPNALPRGR